MGKAGSYRWIRGRLRLVNEVSHFLQDWPSYPPVAKSVRTFRTTGKICMLLTCLSALVTFLLGTMSDELRTNPGNVTLFLSIACICSHIYISKCAALDENLAKRREQALPWQWWISPVLMLVIGIAGMSLYMLYVVG